MTLIQALNVKSLNTFGDLALHLTQMQKSCLQPARTNARRNTSSGLICTLSISPDLHFSFDVLIKSVNVFNFDLDTSTRTI
jgi:hypothetical protein